MFLKGIGCVCVRGCLHPSTHPPHLPLKCYSYIQISFLSGNPNLEEQPLLEISKEDAEQEGQHFLCDDFEDALNVLRKHELEHTVKYSIWHSPRNFSPNDLGRI